ALCLGDTVPIRGRAFNLNRSRPYGVPASAGEALHRLKPGLHAGTSSTQVARWERWRLAGLPEVDLALTSPRLFSEIAATRPWESTDVRWSVNMKDWNQW